LDYFLKYHKAVKNDKKRINISSRKRIKEVIKSRLTKAPNKCGEPLKGPFKKFLKLRIGDYRIIYRVEGLKITILAIGHRKNIYSMLQNLSNSDPEK
jgi:mRNA interferase RelE/StbE